MLVASVWWLLLRAIFLADIQLVRTDVPLSVDRCSILVTDQPIRQTVSEIYFISCWVAIVKF